MLPQQQQPYQQVMVQQQRQAMVQQSCAIPIQARLGAQHHFAAAAVASRLMNPHLAAAAAIPTVPSVLSYINSHRQLTQPQSYTQRPAAKKIPQRPVASSVTPRLSFPAPNEFGRFLTFGLEGSPSLLAAVSAHSPMLTLPPLPNDFAKFLQFGLDPQMLAAIQTERLSLLAHAQRLRPKGSARGGVNSVTATEVGAGRKRRRPSQQKEVTSGSPYIPKKSAKKVSISAAAEPHQVSRALTLKGGTLAWALVKGHKFIENRPYRLPVGWIAVHVGKGVLKGELLAKYRSLCPPGSPTEEELMAWGSSKIVGCIRICEHRLLSNCGGSGWASGPVCNVLDACVMLPEPVPVPRGALGLWPIPEAAMAALRTQLTQKPSTAKSSDPTVLAVRTGAVKQIPVEQLLPPFEPIVGPVRKRAKHEDKNTAAAPGLGAMTNCGNTIASTTDMMAKLPPPLPQPLSMSCPAPPLMHLHQVHTGHEAGKASIVHLPSPVPVEQIKPPSGLAIAGRVDCSGPAVAQCAPQKLMHSAPKKDGQEGNRGTEMDEGGDEQDEPQLWVPGICEVCTYKNTQGSGRCTLCQSPVPRQAPKGWRTARQTKVNINLAGGEAVAPP